MNSDSDIYKETLDHEFQTIRNKIDTLCPLQSTPCHSTNSNSIDLRSESSQTSMDSSESSKAKECIEIDDEDSDLEDDNTNHDKYEYNLHGDKPISNQIFVCDLFMIDENRKFGPKRKRKEEA